MTSLFALYAALVAAVLAKILYHEYQHMQRTRESVTTVSSGGFNASRRIQEALTEWTQERAECDLAQVQPLIFEPPEIQGEWRGVAPEPVPEPPRPEPAPPIEETAVPLEEKLDIDFQPQGASHYEVLQISRTADPETIHRVYRMMASRFHPDNTESGDVEKFLALQQAYQVLSDAGARAEYDRSLAARETTALAVFGQRGFVEGLDGERNRRLGVLSLLYNRRRLNEDKPGMALLDLERLMSFPREHLQFTLWYLRSKGYVTVEDNSDYGVTPSGVDYLEEQSTRNHLIRNLLLGETAPPPEALRAIRAPRRNRSSRRSRRALASAS